MNRYASAAELTDALHQPVRDFLRIVRDDEAAVDLKTISLLELASMPIPEREMVLSPILPSKGLAMLFAQRGIGKTHVAINAAYAVATAGRFLKWQAPAPRRVLYCDGEMPAIALQERVNQILASAEKPLPDPQTFRFLAMDMQDLGVGLNLALPEHQRRVEAELADTELLVLDNLSTLVSGGRENDAESWDSMQAWLLRLRRRGLSVLMVHHAGRGENARGTSKREDVLDTVIHLKRPENYQTSEGARFEVHLTKARGVFGEDAAPFEAKLEECDGRAIWTMRGIVDLESEQVIELTKSRMSVRDIASELGIGKSAVHRIQTKAREEGRL